MTQPSSSHYPAIVQPISRSAAVTHSCLPSTHPATSQYPAITQPVPSRDQSLPRSIQVSPRHYPPIQSLTRLLPSVM
eukprot:747109-Lingulodinium_polyedra.AAC.3